MNTVFATLDRIKLETLANASLKSSSQVTLSKIILYHLGKTHWSSVRGQSIIFSKADNGQTSFVFVKEVFWRDASK